LKIEIPDEYFSEEELKNTPKRFEEFIEDWMEDDFEFKTFENPDYDEIISLKDVKFYSLCSHHLLPFFGEIHVGYIPDEKIAGLSKLARAVDKVTHRPHVQEQLTEELVDFLEENLEPKGTMVIVEAEHLCMSMRGIKKPGHRTVTSAIRGVFANPPAGKNPREEFLRLIR